MKFFTNQNIWKKIVTVLLIVLVFQAIVINPVHAKDKDSKNDVLEGGGKLLKPIFSLLVTTGDGITNLLHSSIMGVDETLIKINNEGSAAKIIKYIIAVVITAACIIGMFVLTGPIALVLKLGAILSIATGLLPGTNFIVKMEDQVQHAVMSFFTEEELPAKLYLPMYSYSPEEIFRGNILLFNVNFFRDPIQIKDATKIDEDGNSVLSYHYYEDEQGDELDTDGDGNKDTKGYVTSKQDSAEFLQKTISSWYNAIRNICLVLMLSVLVYIGIRILLASVASDKAKYQTMLKDWFIGLCLLFLMHYIMAFSVTMVDKITDVVSSSLDREKYIAFIPHTKLIEDSLKETGYEEIFKMEEDGKKGYAWPTNLMGFLRVKAQMDTDGWRYIGEAILFLTLCIFTIMFTITYLRRLLYMAFLTIIAPLVALTYCIDKLNDGQAQGFNKWLKEYIFNLLIQPMHLLLYYILITSAFETMGKNAIYSIVAIAFMLPAEKLLRSLFGFEKASTAKATGPAAAMMASTALHSLLHRGPSGKGEGKNESSDGNNSDKVPMPRESNPIDAFLNNGSNDNEGDEGEVKDIGGLQEAEDGSLALGADGVEGVDRGNGLDGANGVNGANGANENDSGDYSVPEGLEQTENGDLALGVGGEEDEKYQRLKDSWKDAGEYLDSDKRNAKQQNEKPKKKSKLRRAVGRRAHAIRMVGRTATRKALQDAKKLPGKGIRMAGRGIAGAAVGTLTAGATVATIAATGDLDNTIKMGVGAAASGFAIGSGTVKNTHVKQEHKDVYHEAMNSDEYQEEAMADYIKKYKKDIDNRTYFENELGIKEAKKMYKNGEIDKYIENGITDKKEMLAMHKLKENNIVKNVDEAIAVSQLGEMMGDPNKMNQKNRNDWSARIGNMAEEAGIKKEDKEQFANDRLKQIGKLYDFKNR